MASCPNCGFDLGPDGRCAVCGHGSSGETEEAGSRRGTGRLGKGAAASIAHGGDAPRERTRSSPGGRGSMMGGSKRTPILIGLAAVVLIAGIAAILLLRSPAPNAAVIMAAARKAGGGTKSTASAHAPAGPSSAATTGELGGSRTLSKPSAGNVASAKSSTKQSAANTAMRAAISRVGFAAPVGASPVGIRAIHAVDLYNPARQPVYALSRRTQLPPLTNEGAYVAWMLVHTHQQVTYLRERWHRAQLAVERHLVIHKRVLMSFLLTPREWFARPYNLSQVYANTALPIGYGQTISGPDLVMHMTDALDPQPDQRVLEIGTGSGYQSAILSQLSNYVYTIEIVRPLARQTNEIYLSHTKQMPEYANIHRRLADGYYGWPSYAPFERIIVTTGIDHIPPDLLKELKPGGIMVIPIGPPTGQTILKITKTVDRRGRVHLTRTNLYPGITDIFVPFTASGGGTHDRGGGR